MMWTFFLIFIYLFTNADASFVYTNEMAQACRVHDFKGDFTYETVYLVDDKKLKKQKKDNDIDFEIHLAIQSMKDAHISLSSALDPDDNDAEYKIVVGGDNNTSTQLIQRKTNKSLCYVITPNILAPLELRGFYVKITQHGLIEFGKEGEFPPLILFKTVGPLEIKYIGFSGQLGTPVKFLFKCPTPRSDGDESITTGSRKIEGEYPDEYSSLDPLKTIDLESEETS